MKISLQREIAASRDHVWRELSDLASHVTWMADAADISFVTPSHSGLGTQFVCVTKVGPLTTRDVMTVVAWEDHRLIGVSHTGLVTGVGQFEIHGDEHVRLSWTEELHFPWTFGGRLGEFFARPLLIAVWKGNLRRFAQRVGG
jgi:uncharacterized protein YndB with AHSA1/START domain